MLSSTLHPAPKVIASREMIGDTNDTAFDCCRPVSVYGPSLGPATSGQDRPKRLCPKVTALDSNVGDPHFGASVAIQDGERSAAGGVGAEKALGPRRADHDLREGIVAVGSGRNAANTVWLFQRQPGLPWPHAYGHIDLDACMWEKHQKPRPACTCVNM